MTTNEQRQAIAAYADLAENGTMRPADRQNLRHLLTVISEQAAKLDAVQKLTQAAWDGPVYMLPGGYPSKPVESFDLRRALETP